MQDLSALLGQIRGWANSNTSSMQEALWRSRGVRKFKVI